MMLRGYLKLEKEEYFGITTGYLQTLKDVTTMDKVGINNLSLHNFYCY